MLPAPLSGRYPTFFRNHKSKFLVCPVFCFISYSICYAPAEQAESAASCFFAVCWLRTAMPKKAELPTSSIPTGPFSVVTFRTEKPLISMTATGFPWLFPTSCNLKKTLWRKYHLRRHRMVQTLFQASCKCQRQTHRSVV